jgi:hypothetical protein
MRGRGIVAVVGARALPAAWAAPVGAVVRHFLGRGWGIGSGGAVGADAYALDAVVAAGAPACRRSVVFLPGPAPCPPRGALGAFRRLGGTVIDGPGPVDRAALLARSRRLAEAAAGVVAFLWGPSRGSVYTVRAAIRAGRRAAVVLAGGGAELPVVPGGRWVACQLGPVAAFRWESDPPPAPAPPPSSLARIFAVPDGEPVGALLAHVSRLTPGERLWFEAGVRAGDRILVPVERGDDGTPAMLAVDRLMRRLRCSAREAGDLAECLRALDADRGVVDHYVAEGRRRGVAPVVAELCHWAARLGAAAPVPDADALDHAEALGDDVDRVTADGRLVAGDGDADAKLEPSTLGWRALGALAPERPRCPACGMRYAADADAADLPRCPRCGTPDTWETRQDPAFRAWLTAIAACRTRLELAAVGRRLYAAHLPRAQAGVAWTHYRLRQAALEAAAPLGPAARQLLAAIEAADPGALPRLGASLYRRQHAPVNGDGAAITVPEWRRLWGAYRARRPARPA